MSDFAKVVQVSLEERLIGQDADTSRTVLFVRLRDLDWFKIRADDPFGWTRFFDFRDQALLQIPFLVQPRKSRTLGASTISASSSESETAVFADSISSFFCVMILSSMVGIRIQLIYRRVYALSLGI